MCLYFLNDDPKYFCPEYSSSVLADKPRPTQQEVSKTDVRVVRGYVVKAAANENLGFYIYTVNIYHVNCHNTLSNTVL